MKKSNIIILLEILIFLIIWIGIPTLLYINTNKVFSYSLLISSWIPALAVVVYIQLFSRSRSIYTKL